MLAHCWISPCGSGAAGEVLISVTTTAGEEDARAAACRASARMSRSSPAVPISVRPGGRSSPGSARAGDIGLGWRLAVSWEAGAFIWLAPL
jgi:hypothetical protein